MNIVRADATEVTPVVIAQLALGKLKTELHLARNVTKATELTPATVGATVDVPKLGAVTASQKQENTGVTVQNPAMDKVSISLDQHWEATIAVEDYAKAVADRDISNTYLGDMVTALAEKIETRLAGLVTSFTTNNVIAGGTSFDEDDILNARKVLTDQRAPMADRYMYLETGAINRLLKIDRFTEVAKYGNNVAIQDGEIGRIHGFRVFESIHVNSSGSPTTYNNIAFHKRAMVLATRPLPRPQGAGVNVSTVTDQESGVTLRVLQSYNSNYLADQLTLDVLFGVGVLREELGIKITTQ